MASKVFCPCCLRVNKLSPEEVVAKSNDSIERDVATEVTMENDSDHEPDGSWSVTGVFRKVFHASPDNKLAVKLFGSKKGVIREKKRQDSGCKMWMIHPYSHFRYSTASSNK